MPSCSAAVSTAPSPVTVACVREALAVLRDTPQLVARLREVVARVRALLRRVDRARTLAVDPPPVLRCGDLVVDRAERRVLRAGREVHLTPLEFELLATLALTPGTVRTRADLMEEVWGWADARGTRTLDSHVKALRAKIGADRVRTVHGVGYALEASHAG